MVVVQQLLVFANQIDWPIFFEYFEKKNALIYGDAAVSASRNPEQIYSYKGIPDLGYASAEQAALCKSFLCAEAQGGLQKVEYETDSGEKRYQLIPKMNVGTIQITPAGVFGSTILSGYITNVGANIASEELMRSALRCLSQAKFVKHSRWWVGPNAIESYRHGARLATLAASSPADFDLHLKML